MGTAQLAFAEVERGEATGSDVIGSGSDRTRKWSRDPEGCTLGCTHPQPEVGVFPPFFRVFSDMLCSTSRPRSASCTRKTFAFKRCGLKKYGEKIRENEMFNNIIYSDVGDYHIRVAFLLYFQRFWRFLIPSSNFPVDLLQFCHRSLR
jgi:hypothetical protein